MTDMRYATVITDASFDHNDNSAGWAAWIRIDGIDAPIKRYGSFKCKVETSIHAEKKAAINGIAIAKSMGADAVLLQTDCMSVVHCINGFTKKKAALLNWNLWMLQAGLVAFPVKAQHVKGHTSTNDARSYVNRWCDKMAGKARISSRAI